MKLIGYWFESARWGIARMFQAVYHRVVSFRDGFAERWYGFIYGPKSFLKLGVAAIAVLTIVLCIGAGVFYWFLQPSAKQGGEREVIIAYASSARAVANQLEAEGIIKNADSFFWYMRLTGQFRHVKAGVYRLRPGLKVHELMSLLKKGTSLVYRVTVPEGLTLREIAHLMVSKGLGNEERYLQIAKSVDFIEENIVGFGKVDSAEGFLFPDTYEFAHGTTEEEVLATMVRRFSEIWQAENKGNKSGKTAYEAVILASVVEEEAKTAEERPIIAGVFNNRISRGIPLESCATVQYALGTRKSRLLYKDLQVDSDYNTYRYRGLPPGPIASPGRESLRAALQPKRHSYLYFVAKPDGGHIFSNTYKQHLDAQRRLRVSTR